MQRILPWIIVLLSFMPKSAVAAERIQLHHINTKGYSVRVVYRDVNGIIWLGTTSGLLTLPQLDSRNPSGCHRNTGSANVNMSIKRISGDSHGRLWIKTNYNDNYLYDPQTNEFIEDTHALLSPLGIDIVGEFTVLAESTGRTLIWNDNRLYWFADDAAKAEMITLNNNVKLRQVCVYGDQIMALSQSSLHLLSVHRRQPLETISLPSDIDMRGIDLRGQMLLSADGTSWIWTSNKVLRYADHKWTIALQTASDITGIVQDSDNRLWVATESAGVYLCDSEGQMLTHLQHHPGDKYGLLSNQVETITYEPSSQSVLIAYTKGGLSVYSSRSSDQMQHNIDDPADSKLLTDVLAIAPAAGQGVLIGLENRGVWLHNSHSDTNIISGGSAISLHVNAAGDLWTGIYSQGLIRRTASGQQRTFFEGSSPFAIAEDEQGNIFTALLGKGVWQLNASTGEMLNTNLQPKYTFDLQYHQHHLYAATTEGLWSKAQQGQWQRVIDGHFRFLRIDEHGYMWLIGNEGSEGLTLLTPAGKPVDLPLDLKTAPLKSIALDKHGNLWAITTSELLMLRYHPGDKKPLQRHSFRVNTLSQQVFYNPHTSIVDDNGMLWLGTTSGYQCIDTNRLTAQMREQSQSHQFMLASISINDNLLSPGQEFNGRVVFNQDVVFTHELSLRYNENNLVLEYFYPFFDHQLSEVCYYQLRGLNNTWHLLEGNAITLSNLPPGNYQLIIRTQSSEPFQLLNIHIAPPFWLSWWAYCLYALLLIVLIAGIDRIIRNRRAYQQQLHRLEMDQQQQSQMNELKLRFFTNISHDLRTPLTLIISPVEELLRAEQLDKPMLQSSLSMIHRNAQHLLSLVNQILDFRRLESGKEKLLASYGDIVSLIRDTCDSFRHKAEKEQIRFTFLPSVERVETMFDSDKTTKILMNLLSNAFKFTDAGGSITVRLDISDQTVIISVADTGIGIDDSIKPHLFDRFYQSDPSHRNSMGSGIGLHIVREYVHLQGGEISVIDNEAEGQGSIFRFTLPLKKSQPVVNDNENEDENEDENVDENEMMPEEAESTSPTLLLVDDNSDLLSYMSQSLHDKYHILTAHNGIEALQLLGQHDVDIIISDIMMPEMDGLELCRRIKTDLATSHIPVALLTAKAMTNDELLGLEAGADDYITKPFSMDILRQRIHNIMERSRQHHERFAHEIDIAPSDITVTSLDEQFIANAIAIVEEHIAEPDFSIKQLSDAMGIHRAQLYKKLQHLTGKSPQHFVRLLRLKRGRQLLEQSGLYVSEVAYKVGFNSPRIFSKYFKEEFGVTPKEFVKGE